MSKVYAVSICPPNPGHNITGTLISSCGRNLLAAPLKLRPFDPPRIIRMYSLARELVLRRIFFSCLPAVYCFII